MTDTVAYICVIVPVLTGIGKWANDCNYEGSFKGWVKQFFLKLFMIAASVALVCGTYHLAGKFDKPANPPALESPK